MIRESLAAVAVAVVIPGMAVLTLEARAEDAATAILRHVQNGRAEAGAKRLERRPELDAVALARAQHVASLPHHKRLSLKQPIGVLLEEANVTFIRRAWLHLDMHRGFTDPAAAFLRNWKRYDTAWAGALDSAADGVGAATARAEDGWVIFTAVFIVDEPVPDDLPALEHGTVVAVNEFRRRYGLPAMAFDDGLASIARAHSEDMARRAYFDHRSPEGYEANHRVRAAGRAYRIVAENIYKVRGMEDPVREAVDGWAKSEGHRKNMLGTDFDRSGVGVAVTADGTVFFTQLLLASPLDG